MEQDMIKTIEVPKVLLEEIAAELSMSANAHEAITGETTERILNGVSNVVRGIAKDIKQISEGHDPSLYAGRYIWHKPRA